MQSVHLLVSAGEREGRRAVRAAVFGDLLADASGIEEQIEVSEHLPDDQQGLLEDGLLGPQVGGDPVRGGLAGAERGDDPLAAALVVGQPLRDERDVIGDVVAVPGVQAA